jgi:cob(I)alamin adenosyltransferase
VDEVKQKQKELMDQGMSAAAAFKEAVIQAGEARLDVGGVSESEQAFKQAEAAVTNFKNALLQSTIATLDQAGAFDGLSDAAIRMTLIQQLTELDAKAREMGLQFDSSFERLVRSGNLARMSTEELRAEVIRVDNALSANQDSWVRTGDVAVAAMKHARAEARQVAAELNALFLEITGLAGIELDWAGGIGEGFDYLAAGAQAGRAFQQQQALLDQRDEIMRQAGQPGSLGFMYGQQYGGWDGRTGAEARRGFDEAGEAARGYGRALSYVDEEAQKAAEAHSRFLSSFNQELRAAPEDGLYNAEGVANVEAVNKALYEQVEAAGASAATLALLGVATGQFTQEQAEAALKAAVLQEQIRAIAASVAAGDLSIGDALGQLNQAREALDASNLAAVAGTGEGGVSIAVTADTSTAETNLDGTAAQLDALTSEEYIATVGMDINAVIDGATEASRLIGSIPDTKTMTIRWEQSGADVIAALRALGIIV